MIVGLKSCLITHSGNDWLLTTHFRSKAFFDLLGLLYLLAILLNLWYCLSDVHFALLRPLICDCKERERRERMLSLTRE